MLTLSLIVLGENTLINHLLNELAAHMIITDIARGTEIYSDCPWQGHPSTRDRLGTAELKYGIHCRRT